jgi:hypothetical protein
MNSETRIKENILQLEKLLSRKWINKCNSQSDLKWQDIYSVFHKNPLIATVTEPGDRWTQTSVQGSEESPTLVKVKSCFCAETPHLLLTFRIVDKIDYKI